VKLIIWRERLGRWVGWIGTVYPQCCFESCKQPIRRVVLNDRRFRIAQLILLEDTTIRKVYLGKGNVALGEPGTDPNDRFR
jgi:hypothetical protein